MPLRFLEALDGSLTLSIANICRPIRPRRSQSQRIRAKTFFISSHPSPDEASNCGEVSLSVTAEGDEGDIFTASAFDVPTTDEASGIGKEDDFERHNGIIGRCAGCVIVVMTVKGGELIGHFVVDKVVECVFERAGLELLFEDNG